MVSRRGELPSVRLNGIYVFQTATPTLYEQLDWVDVRFVDNTQSQASSDDDEECPWEGCAAAIWSHSAVGVLGGGVTYDLSSRVGLRADARAYLQHDPVRVLLDTSPFTSGGPRNTIAFTGTPAIQISTAGQPSSLSVRLGGDDPIEVSKGGGVRALFSVTGGVFFRF